MLNGQKKVWHGIGEASWGQVIYTESQCKEGFTTYSGKVEVTRSISDKDVRAGCAQYNTSLSKLEHHFPLSPGLFLMYLGHHKVPYKTFWSVIPSFYICTGLSAPQHHSSCTSQNLGVIQSAFLPSQVLLIFSSISDDCFTSLQTHCH